MYNRGITKGLYERKTRKLNELRNDRPHVAPEASLLPPSQYMD